MSFQVANKSKSQLDPQPGSTAVRAFGISSDGTDCKVSIQVYCNQRVLKSFLSDY